MLPAAKAASWAPRRAEAQRKRICVNMSPGTVVTTSMLRLGRRPCASALVVGGVPWPIAISTEGEIDTFPPESAISWNSSSER